MKLKLRTLWGETEVVATPIGDGLYVHRKLKEPVGWWTISNAEGWRIVDVQGSRKKAMELAQKHLAGLPWGTKKGITTAHKEAVDRLKKEGME